MNIPKRLNLAFSQFKSELCAQRIPGNSLQRVQKLPETETRGPAEPANSTGLVHTN